MLAAFTVLLHPSCPRFLPSKYTMSRARSNLCDELVRISLSRYITINNISSRLLYRSTSSLHVEIELLNAIT